MTTAPANTAHAAPPILPPPKRPPEIVSAWPRSAQLAAVFVLGGVTALLGAHGVASVREGCRPADDDKLPVTYRVDLNTAPRAELMQLPGVGPSLADRIEAYRHANNGFRSVDDLIKVPGIGKTTLEKLRPFVCVEGRYQPAEAPKANPAAPVKPAPAKPAADEQAPKKQPAASTKEANLKEPINVNTASLPDLQKLPGIGPKLSQRIVDEREKKLFATVDDLRRVPGIGVKTLDKLRPYVTVGP
jgi:competence protein ComEA